MIGFAGFQGGTVVAAGGRGIGGDRQTVGKVVIGRRSIGRLHGEKGRGTGGDSGGVGRHAIVRTRVKRQRAGDLQSRRAGTGNPAPVAQHLAVLSPIERGSGRAGDGHGERGGLSFPHAEIQRVPAEHRWRGRQGPSGGDIKDDVAGLPVVAIHRQIVTPAAGGAEGQGTLRGAAGVVVGSQAGEAAHLGAGVHREEGVIVTVESRDGGRGRLRRRPFPPDRDARGRRAEVGRFAGLRGGSGVGSVDLGRLLGNDGGSGKVVVDRAGSGDGKGECAGECGRGGMGGRECEGVTSRGGRGIGIGGVNAVVGDLIRGRAVVAESEVLTLERTGDRGAGQSGPGFRDRGQDRPLLAGAQGRGPGRDVHAHAATGGGSQGPVGADRAAGGHFAIEAGHGAGVVDDAVAKIGQGNRGILCEHQGGHTGHVGRGHAGAVVGVISGITGGDAGVNGHARRAHIHAGGSEIRKAGQGIGAVQRGHVHREAHLPFAEEIDQQLGAFASNQNLGLQRGRAQMRCDDHFWVTDNGVIRWQRLGLEDIERGAGQVARVERFEQGLLVNNATAGTVDHPGPGGQQCQLPGPDHMPGLGSEWCVDGDEIALRAEFIHRGGCLDP